MQGLGFRVWGVGVQGLGGLGTTTGLGLGFRVRNHYRDPDSVLGLETAKGLLAGFRVRSCHRKPCSVEG